MSSPAEIALDGRHRSRERDVVLRIREPPDADDLRRFAARDRHAERAKVNRVVHDYGPLGRACARA